MLDELIIDKQYVSQLFDDSYKDYPYLVSHVFERGLVSLADIDILGNSLSKTPDWGIEFVNNLL